MSKQAGRDARDDGAFAVEIAGLTKAYGSPRTHKSFVAVDDVSLAVRPGELAVLLGPSGCGKTTLLRSVAGLEVPTEGTISINGRQVFSAAKRVNLPPELRRVAMMFQSYALWPHMTVGENVAYPLTPQSLSREELRAKVARQLIEMGVGGLEERYPGELSGGQQQRVALARALISQPSVILFDEPLSNVDARVRRRLRAQIRELKHTPNFCGIYVTHDQEEAMELADHLVVMEKGRILQSGPSLDVYKTPQSLQVASFVGELNALEITYATSKAGAFVVGTAIGEFLVNNTALPGDARAGLLIFRPEQVKLHKTHEGAENGEERYCIGTIGDITFLGPRYDMQIVVGSTPIIASVPEPEGTRLRFQPGEQVLLEIIDPRWIPAGEARHG